MCTEWGTLSDRALLVKPHTGEAWVALNQTPTAGWRGDSRLTKHKQDHGSVPVITSGAHRWPSQSFNGEVGDNSFWLLSELTSLLLSRKTAEFRSGSLEPGAGAGGTGQRGVGTRKGHRQGSHFSGMKENTRAKTLHLGF